MHVLLLPSCYLSWLWYYQSLLGYSSTSEGNSVHLKGQETLEDSQMKFGAHLYDLNFIFMFNISNLSNRQICEWSYQIIISGLHQILLYKYY